MRITKLKKYFEKGYTPNWTREIFTIKEVVFRDLPVYILQDLNNETIEGIFYEQELQKVENPNNNFKIDQILKQRTRKGQKEYFVSWLGYPKSFNKWISSEDLK